MSHSWDTQIVPNPITPLNATCSAHMQVGFALVERGGRGCAAHYGVGSWGSEHDHGEPLRAVGQQRGDRPHVEGAVHAKGQVGPHRADWGAEGPPTHVEANSPKILSVTCGEGGGSSAQTHPSTFCKTRPITTRPGIRPTNTPTQNIKPSPEDLEFSSASARANNWQLMGHRDGPLWPFMVFFLADGQETFGRFSQSCTTFLHF